jgi:site-specific DNA recombinase
MRPNRAPLTPATPITVKKRCAVYTRKSTDEGLDQEYNSLEAQRDAGLVYTCLIGLSHCSVVASSD